MKLLKIILIAFILLLPVALYSSQSGYQQQHPTNVVGTVDNSTASSYLYKNANGNIVSATLGAEMANYAGTLTVREVVDFQISASDTAATAAMSKNAYTVPSLFNGMNVTAITCSVYDLNGSNAGNTIVNITKARAGATSSVFSVGANIAYNAYTATATAVANVTAQGLLTGDQLFANVTAVSTANAPKGLSCTVVFAH